MSEESQLSNVAFIKSLVDWVEDAEFREGLPVTYIVQAMQLTTLTGEEKAACALLLTFAEEYSLEVVDQMPPEQRETLLKLLCRYPPYKHVLSFATRKLLGWPPRKPRTE